MLTYRLITGRSRTVLISSLTILLGFLLLQPATAQSDTGPERLSIADAGVPGAEPAEAGQTFRTTPLQLTAPSVTPHSALALSTSHGTGAAASALPTALQARTTSLRGMLLRDLPSGGVDGTERLLRGPLVNRQDLPEDAPFPRQPLLGLSEDGSLVTGPEQTTGRETAPRIGLPLNGTPGERIDPGTEGMVIMSIDL